MFGMLRRMVQIGACAAILAVWQLPAYAAPAACVAAWRNADKLVKVGQLRAAKVSMLKCAHYTCGGVLSKECGRRVAEIENDTPTIVPVVKDEDGDALADVSLAMDGELVANRIDGRAVMVDPGTHEFTFQRGNRVLASYQTTILQGQRNRTVEVSLDGDRPMVKTRLPPGSLVGAAIAPSASGAAAEGQQLNFTPDQVEEESGGGRRVHHRYARCSAPWAPWASPATPGPSTRATRRTGTSTSARRAAGPRPWTACASSTRPPRSRSASA